MTLTTFQGRSRWRHPSLALLLPTLLLATGAWQVARMEGVMPGIGAQVARLDASVARLQALAAREPGATVRFGGTQEYTVAEALERVAGRRAELESEARLEQGRAAAAWTTVAGSGLVLAAVLACLAVAAVAARRGRRSRAALVGSFGGVVRALPVLLGSIAIGTAVAVLGGVGFEVTAPWVAADTGMSGIKLILAGLVFAGAAVMFAVRSVRQLRRVLDAFAPQPMPVLGRAARLDEAPGLWEFVRGVAAGQGAGAPDSIVLGMMDGFFVTSSRLRLEPEGRELTGRSLYLPAPLLPLLSRAEATAIIAHELAHFTGEDTEYSQHVLPLFAGLERAAAAMEPQGAMHQGADMAFQPASILAGHVLGTFEALVGHWSRVREFEADRASLRAGSARGAATALVRTGIATGILNNALAEVYEHPDDAGHDVVGAVLARAALTGFPDADRHVDDRQPHPTDTHPPNRQRIEALGILVDARLLVDASRPVQPEDAAFAGGLFTDWPGLRQVLGADLVAAAKARSQQVQAGLREAAGAMPDAVVIHEQPRAAVAVLGGFGAVLVAGGAFFAWMTGSGRINPGEDAYGIGFAVVFTTLGALLLWAAWVRLQRAKAGPYLVIGADGFQAAGIKGLVPWSDLEGVEVMAGLQSGVTFRFKPSAPLPEQTGRRWSAQVDRKRRTLLLHGYVPRGLSTQAFMDLLNRAMQAHRARELLQGRALEQPVGNGWCRNV